MSRVFIGIGSNQGDRAALIARAVRMFREPRGMRLVRSAPVIESEPVGGPPQGPYLNTVVELETTLTPEALLATLQAIERAFGRVLTDERWGPRPMDLDILLYGHRVVQTPALTIPHPRLHERCFVLEPLAQLAPELIHPVLDETIAALLARLPSPQSARA